MKKITLLGVIVLCTISVVIVINLYRKPQIQLPEGPTRPMPGTAALKIVKNFPDNASKSQLIENIKPLFKSINQSKRSELRTMKQALELLRFQPNIIAALQGYYHGLSKDKTADRLLTVKVIGAMRRQEALPVLRKIVYEPIPPISENHKSSTQLHKNETIIRRSAVRGITYLRTKEALEETISVILKHPERHVQIEAIEAYMWNLNDSKTAAATLERIVPPSLIKFITRPRYTHGMNPKKFDEQVLAWRANWAQQADPDSLKGVIDSEVVIYD
jgi:hypothetical protein